MTTVIGILLIVMAIFLVIAVLMQSSKDHRMGASIAGGAETFFGKAKGKTMDAMFNKLTTVIAIIFVILVVVLYVIQPEPEALYMDADGNPITAEQLEELLAQQGTADDTADDEANGDVAEGDEANGDVAEGDVVEGDVVEGDVVEGDVTAPEADTPAENEADAPVAE